MKKFRAELHTHTVLSPCASIEMIPPLIISEALSKNIDILAITDHNSIANVQAVMDAAHGTGITIIPGIELQTREEIHSICLFDTMQQAQSFYDIILPAFPDIQNNSDFFGEQFVVDKTGDFIRREERLLISSANLTLSEAFHAVNWAEGLLIPAHVDRSTYGLFPTLGFVPDDIELEILEISKLLDPLDALQKFPQLSGYQIIQNGDAHFLNEILGFNEFYIENICISEIIQALKSQNGRKYTNLFHTIM